MRGIQLANDKRRSLLVRLWNRQLQVAAQGHSAPRQRDVLSSPIGSHYGTKGHGPGVKIYLFGSLLLSLFWEEKLNLFSAEGTREGRGMMSSHSVSYSVNKQAE